MRKFRRVFRSPFFEVATALKNLPVDELETIAPFAVAPWTERINTIVDGAEVEPWSEAHRDGNVRIAVSSSARNDLVGVGGVVEMPQVSQGGPKLVKFSFLLGERSGQNVFAGELAAAAYALRSLRGPRHRDIALATRSKAAVLTLRNPRQQSAQEYARCICEETERHEQMGTQ
ncbi:hypothetical protein VDGD_21330 [Verticillium dahliae]|nr:hypothetical protein VDGD_21330 [Verticillium dahliae]